LFLAPEVSGKAAYKLAVRNPIPLTPQGSRHA
jgi:hypothetical protein